MQPAPPRRALLRTAAVGLPVLALGALAGCTGEGVAGRAGSDDAITLTVFAAASLRTVLEQVGTEFTAAHPGTAVRFSFAGSADLVAQLDAGAPADLLITADQRTMTLAQENGSITGKPVVIATNIPVLITPAGNPAAVTDLAGAVGPDVDLVVCAPQVPCGAAAAAVAEQAGLTLAPVSEETSVTDVLGKVTSGQADAGIVYATDAADAGDAVTTIDLPGADQARTEYPAAVTASSAHPEQALALLDALSAPAAQQLLANVGFGAP